MEYTKSMNEVKNTEILSDRREIDFSSLTTLLSLRLMLESSKNQWITIMNFHFIRICKKVNQKSMNYFKDFFEHHGARFDKSEQNTKQWELYF